MKQSHRVLKQNFQVALCMIFICLCCCWTSSLSQSINGKHVVHTNKKSSTIQSGLAPLSPDAILSMHDVDTDDEDDEEDKSDDDYLNSNENEFGSSGSELIGTGSGGELDEFQKNELPFFLKEPEDEFIIKKKPAVLKCITTHAYEVCLLFRRESCLSTLHPHIFKIM